MSNIKELSFSKDNSNEWYIDIPGPDWVGSQSDLQMVLGADTLLTHLAGDKDNITLLVATEIVDIRDHDNLPMFAKHNWDFLVRGDHIKTFSGKYYNSFAPEYIWLPPVIEFIFENYPKYIYYKIKPNDTKKVQTQEDGPDF